jgi:hypothetical protein
MTSVASINDASLTTVSMRVGRARRACMDRHPGKRIADWMGQDDCGRF